MAADCSIGLDDVSLVEVGSKTLLKNGYVSRGSLSKNALGRRDIPSTVFESLEATSAGANSYLLSITSVSNLIYNLIFKVLNCTQQCTTQQHRNDCHLHVISAHTHTFLSRNGYGDTNLRCYPRLYPLGAVPVPSFLLLAHVS